MSYGNRDAPAGQQYAYEGHKLRTNWEQFLLKNRVKKLSSENQEIIYFLTIIFPLENIILLLPSPNPCFVSQKHLGAMPSQSKLCVQGFFL